MFSVPMLLTLTRNEGKLSQFGISQNADRNQLTEIPITLMQENTINSVSESAVEGGTPRRYVTILSKVGFLKAITKS